MKRTLTYERLADEFVSRLEASSRDRFVMGKLRRYPPSALINCPPDALSYRPEVYPIFYQLLPAEFRGRKWPERACLFVATSFPRNPRRTSASFGASLRTLAKRCDGGKRQVEICLEILFQSPTDYLLWELYRTIRLLAMHDVPINWRQLLVDLLRWEEADHPVQRQWALDFAGGVGQSD